MTQYDAFENDLALAMSDYADDAPASIDSTAYVRALRAARLRGPTGQLQRRFPRYGWLLLAALLGVALLASIAVGFGDRWAVVPVPSPSPSASPSASATLEALAFTRLGDLWMLTDAASGPALVSRDIALDVAGEALFAGNERWLHWSSDGATLAITGPLLGVGSDVSYCVATFEPGSNVTRQLPVCQLPWSPLGWAPDNNSLLLVRGAGGDYPPGLLAFNLNSTEASVLSDRSVCVPVVSPDGDWIAAVDDNSILVAGTTDYVWSEVAAYSGYSCGIWTGWDAPTWSSDSERIAYVSGLDGRLGAPPNDDPAARVTISISNRDGSEPHVLTDQAAAWALPRWSPDGEWICYRGNDGLHLVRPDGTDDQLVMEGPIDRGRVSWSADGSRIYFGVPVGDSYYGEITVWVYDLETNATELVNTGGAVTDFAPRP